jgi:hypothetical protein
MSDDGTSVSNLKHIKCEFESSAESDKQAQGLLDILRSINIIVDIAKLELVEPPEDSLFWSRPVLSLSPAELELEWRINAPEIRKPRAVLTIHRFTGDAVLILAMRDKDGSGPEYGYGGHEGRCAISDQKF